MPSPTWQCHDIGGCGSRVRDPYGSTANERMLSSAIKLRLETSAQAGGILVAAEKISDFRFFENWNRQGC